MRAFGAHFFKEGMRKSKKAKYLPTCENVIYSPKVVSERFENFLARSSEVKVPECRKPFLAKKASFLWRQKQNIPIQSSKILSRRKKNLPGNPNIVEIPEFAEYCAGNLPEIFGKCAGNVRKCACKTFFYFDSINQIKVVFLYCK